MRPLLSVDEALARVLEHVPRPRSEAVSLADALGCVLAEDVLADRDYPAFPRSRVDGFAVRAADARDPKASLPVVMEVPAGVLPSGPLPPGTAARIFTGAPAPEGADCVVMQEDTAAGQASGGSKTVLVARAPARGDNLVPVAFERARGAAVARAGDVVTAALVGALASVGASRPVCALRPRVRVVATGDEVVPVDSAPGPGCIRNSNAPALAAAAISFGAVADRAYHAADTRDALDAALAQALQADICLLTGGVSVGDYDLVPAALADAGVTRVLHGVRLQPGKPLWFGVRGSTLVFGLPGNPVSSLVTAALFVRPAVRRLLGLRPESPGPRRATLAAPLPRGTWRRRFDPVRLEHLAEGGVSAHPVAYRGSGDIFGFAAADALAVVLEDSPALPAGAEIDVVPLPVWTG